MTTPDVSDDDFREILAQTRHFVRTAVVPRESEILAEDKVPDELRDQAKKMGLFGYAIPQEWGGLGLNIAQDVELAMELGYTSLALRSMFGTNNGIAGQVLVGFGTDEQKARWLEPIASGEVVASFALTEPGAGSNPSGLKTKATKDVADEDHWVINGRKQYITNAPVADLFIVFARTRPADAEGPGIAVFLVPANTPGVEIGVKDAKMGQEGAWTSDVNFTDVRVGRDTLVGGSEDIGYRARDDVAGAGTHPHRRTGRRLGPTGAGRVGGLRGVRHQGGTPIGSFQLVQAMLADQQTGVLAGRALVRDAAQKWLHDEDRRIAPSVAKLFCTEMAGKVADLAVQVHGGAGCMRGVPVERIYREVRLLRLYEGTSEIQRLIIGGGLVRKRSHPVSGRLRQGRVHHRGGARRAGRTPSRWQAEGADIIAVDIAGKLPDCVPYDPPLPEDLAETVALVETTGAASFRPSSTSATSTA